MAPFLKNTPDTMATGFDLTHYVDVSGFLDKTGKSTECTVIHDTKILCASSAARDIVLAKLAKIAEHAEKEEQGTYTFYVLKSLDHDNQIRILERYASWDAFHTHQNYPGLAKLWLGSKEEVKSLEQRAYAPNHKGWLHR